MKKYALALMALAITSCASEKPEEKAEVSKAVKSVKLGDANSSSMISFPGKVIAGKEAVITFKVAGKLNEFPVKEGQEVKQGQIIAKLDQKDFNFAYAKQLATYNENNATFKRAEELIKNRYISQSDFDTRKKAYEVAKADLNIAKTKNPFSMRMGFNIIG